MAGEPADPVIQEKLRGLPQVGALAASAELAELVAGFGQAAVTRAVRARVGEARAALLAGQPCPTIDAASVRRAVEADVAPTLVPAINATGVVVHTNLGRAPLAAAALEAVRAASAGYATVEYDLEEGRRGSRDVHAAALLRELTGAEDALVVNNGAAAVLLALAALARGREVIVSRSELVEIGGGFRVPDVMAQSGARLVEVGTTNRTHQVDYARAMNDDTALLLRVHRSNFAIVGFTKDVPVDDLVSLAEGRGLHVMVDAGSGCLRALSGCPAETPVSELVSAGVGLVTFSGDKLLGGPQAGIVVGKAALVGALRRHPLMRALRADKMCLAALGATLRLARDEPSAVPVERMIRTSAEELEARAEEIVRAVAARVVGAPLDVARTEAPIGGGTSPLCALEGRAVRVAGAAEALARRLRLGRPPIVARVDDGAVLLELRTVPPEADAEIVRALTELLVDR